MGIYERTGAGVCGLIVSFAAVASGSPVFVDSFNVANTYSAASSNAVYAVTDESIPGTWTAAAGQLTYSRPNSGSDPAYNYASSVLLTKGSTPETGSVAGLTEFTVTATIRDIPQGNTAQAGLVIAGSLGSGAGTGGYLLENDNGQGGAFVLLAVTGAGLVGDEGNPQQVVYNFGIPTLGDSYDISFTMNRPSDVSKHPSFSVEINDIGPSAPGLFYSGSFTDTQRTSDFGGTQFGYRVRDPLDGQTPSFGPLSLSVIPEPTAAWLLSAFSIAFQRPRVRR